MRSGQGIINSNSRREKKKKGEASRKAQLRPPEWRKKKRRGSSVLALRPLASLCRRMSLNLFFFFFLLPQRPKVQSLAIQGAEAPAQSSFILVRGVGGECRHGAVLLPGLRGKAADFGEVLHS